MEDLPPAALDERQQEAVDLAVEQRLNLFLAGPAGCGKSTTLMEIRRKLREKRLRVACLALTGCAALAIGGLTLHSFAGIGAQMNKPLTWFIELGKAVARALLRDVDVLIIDEVSMLSSELLERFDAVMRSARSSDKPLGGGQTIFIGDFRQLPPVKPFEYCIVRRQEKIQEQRHRILLPAPWHRTHDGSLGFPVTCLAAVELHQRVDAAGAPPDEQRAS